MAAGLRKPGHERPLGCYRAMSLSDPVPKEAVLVVNAHSREDRCVFRRAVFGLREVGIRLIAARAIRDSGEIVVQTVTDRERHRVIRNWLAVLDAPFIA